MKKSTRILAILMAFVMLIGSFTVMGSAYEAYKGSALYDPAKNINRYNDIDKATFTPEQAASMALDELDRMLAKEQIYLNIYIGELDLASVNKTVASVESLLGKVSSLLPLLGDAASLDISAIKGNKRSTANSSDGNVSDFEFITDLFDFLGDIAPIAEKYVNGTVSLGIMNGFIADFIFDVRELAIGLVFGMTKEGEAMDFDAMEDGDKLPAKYTNKENGAITLLQTLLNELVLGEWVKLDQYFDDPTLKANVYYNMYSFADDYTTDADKPYTGKYDYYGWVHPDDWVLVSLGGCVRVTEGATAPAPIYTAMDITGDVNGYDFIETLLQRAFNYLLVPTLNNQTRHALRKWCGVEYLDKYTKRTVYNEATGLWVSNPDYDPNYDGEDYDTLPDNIYNSVFNVNAYMQKATITSGTLVDNLNNIVGDFLGANYTEADAAAGKPYTGLVVDRVSATDSETAIDWTWTYGGNQYLFKNIVSVAKYVIQKTGNALFADYIDVPTVAELEAYTDQQIVAFVLRAILNASVDWMYIPEEGNQTILDVGYAAVEQLAYQDIPQYTYTKPNIEDFSDTIENGEVKVSKTQNYYNALIDKALDILLDVAVYNLNQSFDAVEASGANPIAGAGLIPYQGDNGTWEDTATVVASWAVNEYGPLLAIYGGLNSNKSNNSAANLTMDQVWADIDTIVDSLIPIKPDNEPWISSEISESGLIAKAFIFDYILKPVYTLDASDFTKIFERNNEGSFAKLNGVQIIVNILDNVFDLLFPNVFANEATTVDGVLDNVLLGSMVKDLIMSLGTETFEGATNGVSITGRANDIVKVALPIVNMILGLSDEQEFEEMEIYLPEVITAGEDCTFGVYNGSSGINTGYTDKEGNFTQDILYAYTIDNYVAKRYPAGSTTGVQFAVKGLDKGKQFAGGDSVDVTIENGVLSNGDIVEFNVTYTVTSETGSFIGDNPDTTANEGLLTKTVYAYVGNTDKDDDAIEKEKAIGDRLIKYESEIYLDSGDDLDDIESFGIRIEDNKAQESWQNTEDTNGDGKVDGSDNQIAPTIAAGSIGTVTNTDAANAFVATNTESSATSAFSGQGGTYFLNPFKLAEGFVRYEENYKVDENGDVMLDENGKPIPDGTNNGGVQNGDYEVKVPVTVTPNGGTAVTETLTITIHLYDDYDLPGKFSSAVAKNRQENQYDTDTDGGAAAELWIDYVDALKNAAKLALTPKVGSSFQTFIGKGTTDGYENLYEKYAVELDAAIAALEPYALQTGVEGIRAIIAKNDGYNFRTGTVQAVVNGETRTFTYKIPLEYYETGYKFFGERDYVPHIYDRYRDARGEGQDLIDSQEFYVMAPFTCVEVYGENYDPSDEEIQEYNNSILAAAAAQDNARIIGSVEAAYAEHMLNLTSNRLIALTASKDKLNYALTELCVGVNAGGASYYTADSWEAYQNALTFATNVNKEEVADALGNPTLSPTKVNVAMSELINAWKKLVESCNFTELDAELATSKTYADLGADQTTYTKDSYDAFMKAYEAAVDVDRSMGKTDANQDEVDAIVAALTAARKGLVEAAAAEPSWGFATEDPNFYFCDVNMNYLTLPVTGTDAALQYDITYWPSVLEDGTEVNDFIVGVGECMPEEGVDAIIPQESLENCYTVITPGKHPFDGTEAYGTGTVIQIYADSDDSLIYTYQLVLYGDPNCDGAVDSVDSDFINTAAVMLWDYNDTLYGSVAAAADVDYSGDFEVSDAQAIDFVYIFGTMAIDQVNGYAFEI